MSPARDASVMVTWHLMDESTEILQAVPGRVVQTIGEALPIRVVKIANALLFAERDRRLLSTKPAELITLLNELPVRIGDSQQKPLFGKLMLLARKLGRSPDDAASLEPAK